MLSSYDLDLAASSGRSSDTQPRMRPALSGTAWLNRPGVSFLTCANKNEVAATCAPIPRVSRHYAPLLRRFLIISLSLEDS